MGERILNLSDLSEEAQVEVIDFYEFLKQKHGSSPAAGLDENMSGILHSYSNSDLISSEKDAWTSVVKEKHDIP
jgi:hypothetical protein